jgi:23S rRNA pseudouridine955/2504/2580 synthase
MTAASSITITASENGMRLDRWFRQRYPQIAYGHMQKMFRSGQVRVNGKRAKASLRLADGQCVRIPPLHDNEGIATTGQKPNQKHKALARSMVLYMDEHIMAINKPPGLAVQGGSGTTEHLDAMLCWLQYNAKERPRLVHRLDKDTSGVLLLARSREAAATISEQLKCRKLHKTYWALVIGKPQPETGKLDVPLAKTSVGGMQKVRPADDGKSAVTTYRLIDNAAECFAWLEMQPLTGRTHQLRAHAALMGHPIVGDGKYGGAKAHPGTGIARKLHLHSQAIELPLPTGSKTIRITAPLSEHMLETWQLLGFEE